MKDKNKFKWFFRWSTSLTLATLCLINHYDKIMIQANESRSSHIGTFEGETTFSLSSDTGILPTLQLETQDVYGNTYQYQTDGRSLTIPDTKGGATVKKAILKGRTLENLIPPFSRTMPVSTGHFKHMGDAFLPYMLTKDKKYLFVNKCNVGKKINVALLGDKEFRGITHMSTERQTIIIDYDNIIGLRFYLMDDTDVPLTYDSFMLFEYQEGMENWEIPYLTGTKTVQSPILTLSNEDGSETTEISIGEDLVLRSNGVVYDELDLMTGEFTQRLDENNEVLDEEVVDYVKINSTHMFDSIQEGDISIKGTITPTLGSITVPTDALTFTLNPNVETGQQFIAPDFSISNESRAPIGVELKSFEQVTSVLNDVLPSKYDLWEGLNQIQSKDMALALEPLPSDGWLSLNEGAYYVADTSNAKLGQIKGNSTVDFKFSALHGQAFSEPLTPQYKLTFVFEL